MQPIHLFLLETSVEGRRKIYFSTVEIEGHKILAYWTLNATRIDIESTLTKFHPVYSYEPKMV